MKNKLKQQIANGNLRIVLGELMQIDSVSNTAISLLGRLSAIEKEQLNGTIDYREEQAATNKLRQSIITLVDKIDDQPQSNPSIVYAHDFYDVQVECILKYHNGITQPVYKITVNPALELTKQQFNELSIWLTNISNGKV